MSWSQLINHITRRFVDSVAAESLNFNFGEFFFCNNSQQTSLLFSFNGLQQGTLSEGKDQGILKGKYHCTVDLLSDWFGMTGMTTDNFCFYL